MKKLDSNEGDTMKTVCGMLCIVFAAVLFTGCGTSGRFKTPPGTDLYINNKPWPSEMSPKGVVKRRPFFWSAAKGIPYKLEKDGNVIKEGRLAARFRVTSIFWPPGAIIYWPLGFDSSQTYDLTTGLSTNNP